MEIMKDNQQCKLAQIDVKPSYHYDDIEFAPMIVIRTKDKELGQLSNTWSPMITKRVYLKGKHYYTQVDVLGLIK